MATYEKAKVACEHALVEGVGSGQAVTARAGLIAWPGDRSGRTGHWPMRFAHPATEQGAVLVADRRCPELIAVLP